VISWLAILTFTPAGIVIGFFPIRDIFLISDFGFSDFGLDDLFSGHQLFLQARPALPQFAKNLSA
jgi:hypothetical protein